MAERKSEIIIYQTDDGKTKIEVSIDEDTVWLTQAQMCELFQRDKSVISRHIKNVFEERELDMESVVAKNATAQEKAVVREFRTTGLDGKELEYKKYKEKTLNELSEVERHFIKSIEKAENEIKSLKGNK